MTIKETLLQETKTAMKEKNKKALSTLRMMTDRIQKKEKELLRELSEDEAVQVLQTFKKQTEEEMGSFQNAGRLEQAESLKQDVVLIERFLPKLLSKEEIRRVVDAEMGKMQLVNTPVNKGSLMKTVMPILKGLADNKLISETIDEALKNWTAN